MNRTIHQLDELGELKDLDEFAVYDTDSGYTKRYSADGLNIPVGTYFLYEGTTAPNNHYFICDGTDTTGTEKELAIVYPKLYAKLGNSNVLPDLRGRVPTNASYSTDEIKTGATWIDGKPIYRKVIPGGNWSSTDYSIDVTNLNIDQPIIIKGICRRTDSGLSSWREITGVASSEAYCAYICYNAISKKLDLSKWRINVSDFFVYIEYTKTTDSAETNTKNFIIRAD